MRLKRWASTASIAVATVLIIAKVMAFWVTNSVSLLSSLMDSAFDVLASGLTMLSIIHAATPADEDHRFGHGKLEALGALGQSIFITGASLFLLVEAVRRLIKPEVMHEAPVGIAVMVLSLVLTAVLVLFQRHVIRKTKSVAIAADGLNYKGDLLTNAGVILALILSHYTGWSYFDPLFALLVALVLLRNAYGILRDSADILMDKELPDADRKRIETLVTCHPDVESIHDLRTRSTGERIFIEFHLEMDGGMTLDRAHDITEELERILYAAYPKAEVMMHQEPAGIDDHRLDHSIAQTEKSK